MQLRCSRPQLGSAHSVLCGPYTDHLTLTGTHPSRKMKIHTNVRQTLCKHVFVIVIKMMIIRDLVMFTTKSWQTASRTQKCIRQTQCAYVLCVAMQLMSAVMKVHHIGRRQERPLFRTSNSRWVILHVLYICLLLVCVWACACVRAMRVHQVSPFWPTCWKTAAGVLNYTQTIRLNSCGHARRQQFCAQF